MSDSSLPPGPKGLPIVGSLFDYFRDMLGFLRKTAEQYGDIAYFKLGPREVYLLSHPDLIKDILVTNNRNFEKSRALKRSKIVLGDGLLTSEGDTHLRERRIIQPVFHHKRIKTYADVMTDFSSKIGVHWENGEVVDVHTEMMRLTLAIVVKTLFGTEIRSDADDIGKCLTTIVSHFPRMLFPFSEYLDKLPIPSTRKFYDALETLDRIVYELIEERRKSKEDKDDLLSMLLSAQDEEGGEGLTNLQVRDEAMTLFLAGQESTANSLVWTWYLISQHPEVEERLHDELNSVLGDRLPSIDDLKNLVYTRLVFTESLRLYPPAWTVVRRAIEDCPVDGYVVSPGSDIYMSQYVVHHDPRFYPEPFRFDPERWTQDQSSSLPQFAYFPFGGGPRRCIGESFAWMEGVMLIATIASRWKMHLVPGQNIAPRPLITIRPKYGMKMIMERR
ncbi:cytochrome P450 [Desulfobacterota bacterium AH_259_B03_O07]|nr:cytochrome P450 [Desulfobacterota bacterium AH_259_B03_O07]